MSFQEIIHWIQNGEPVSAGVANRTGIENAQNIQYLRDLLLGANSGEALFARQVPVETNAVVGMAVYFDAISQTWLRASAAVETDATTGFLKICPSAQVWGVVHTKATSNTADILLAGTASLDLAGATIATPESGKAYYLSGSEAGKLTTAEQPVSIPVLQTAGQHADGTYRVFVNTLTQDILKQHRHFKFDMQAAPAGTHVVPDFDERHVINPVDPSKEGWLPANHAIFAGKAPTGAKFGYNLAVSQLGKLWPPIPLASATLDWSRSRLLQPLRRDDANWSGSVVIAANSTLTHAVSAATARVGDRADITITSISSPLVINSKATITTDGQVDITFLNTGSSSVTLTSYAVDIALCSAIYENLTMGGMSVPPELVVLNDDGIWWMSDYYNEVPWPLTYGTSATQAEPPTEMDMRLVVWFTKPTYQNTVSEVSSLQAVTGSGLLLTCPDTGNAANTGHLAIDLDLDLALHGTDTEAGHLAIKRLTGNKFYRGPVLSGLIAGSSNVKLSSPNYLGDTYFGDVTIEVDADINGTEVPVDTVHLRGTTEETYQDVLALGFAAGRDSEIRSRIQIPDHPGLATGATLKLRFRFLNRANATCPASLFSVAYRRLTKPTALLTAAVLPTTDTNLTQQPTSSVSVSGADMYFDCETEAIPIAAGDTLFFTVNRDHADGYAGNVYLLRQRGVLFTS